MERFCRNRNKAKLQRDKKPKCRAVGVTRLSLCYWMREVMLYKNPSVSKQLLLFKYIILEG